MYAGFRLFSISPQFSSLTTVAVCSHFFPGEICSLRIVHGEIRLQFRLVCYVWNMWCVQSRTQTPTIRLIPFGVLLCCVVFRVLMFIRVVVPIKFLLYIFINPYLDQITALRFSLPSFDVRRCVARASSKPNYIVRSRIESIIKHGKSQS